jgi:hypothetical protein
VLIRMELERTMVVSFCIHIPNMCICICICTCITCIHIYLHLSLSVSLALSITMTSMCAYMTIWKGVSLWWHLWGSNLWLHLGQPALNVIKCWWHKNPQSCMSLWVKML